MKRLIYNFLIIVGMVTVLQNVAQAGGVGFTLTSIVQRANGVFFGIVDANGNSKVIGASQAKSLIERTCPNIHIADGVFQ